MPVDEPVARLDLRLAGPAACGWLSLLILSGRSALELALAAGGFVVIAGLIGWRCRARRDGPTAVLACLVVALSLGSGAGHAAVRESGPIPFLAPQRAVVDIRGQVISEPRLVPADAERPARTITKVLVEEVVARGRRSSVHTPVLVLGERDWLTLKWRDEVRARGRLGVAEPGSDVVAILNPRAPPTVTQQAELLPRAAERVRDGVRLAVAELPADARGLVPALVIGDRSLTPADLTDDMRATGMTHLSAVSGSNVAIVLGAVLALCGLVGLPRRWRPWVAGAALAGFVVLARPDPSVLRAAVMGGIGLVGMSASRRAAGLPALAGAVVLLLCVDPWLARSYGFALSVLASLGLLIFARPWADYLARFLPLRLKQVADAVAIPLAAQAACAPVLVLLQGSVTVIGVVANLLAAPLVTPATLLGVVVALVAGVSPTLASAVAWLASAPASGIAWIAHHFADVPMGTMPWPDGPPGALLLAGLTLILLFTGPWLCGMARTHRFLTGAVIVLLGATLWPVGVPDWPRPGWRLVVCDVGQGDAIVIRTTPGHAVLVDAGPDPAAVAACLDRLAVEVLDAVILTHFHADHVGGLPEVLAGRTVRALFATGVEEPAGEVQRVRQAAAGAGLLIRHLGACEVLTWGEVSARVLSPARRPTSGSVPNNGSVVLDLRTGGLRVLLLADVEREAAAQIRRRLSGGCTTPEGSSAEPPRTAGAPSVPSQPAGTVQADVIKVAHHGSSNQDPHLIRMLAPRAAVISVAADNDYGHPAPSLLSLVAQAGAVIYRTDKDGDVMVGVENGHLFVGRSRS